MNIPLPKVVYDVEPGGGIVTASRGINALRQSDLENKMKELQNQYYAPNIESEIGYRNSLRKGQDINNQYMPEKLRLANIFQGLQNQYYGPNIMSEIGLRGAQSRLGGAQADQINYMLKHPGLLGNDQSKMIQSLMDMGIINRESIGSQPFLSNQQSQEPSVSTENPFQAPFPGNVAPFKTGNVMLDSVLNKPYASMAYQQKMAQGFNWVHLPVETKNQYIAQGYGMGIDPLKMADYINQGMNLKQIAEKEGLDPDNLPPPIYPPTKGTLTRVQQVTQVGNELDYLSSAATAAIKPYANTFAGLSPARISDMLSGDEQAQKRFGRYIGALSIQTGVANGRVLLEGGRAGLEVMRMVKDSALRGIDQNSPIKMTGTAFQASQDFIDETLQKGAKIRTSTGMNPFSEISKSRKKTEENNKENEVKVIRDKNGKLMRASS